MIILENQYDEVSPKIRMELSSDTSLPDLLEAFAGFLKAAGYHFDGYVDIVEEQEYTSENYN